MRKLTAKKRKRGNKSNSTSIADTESFHSECTNYTENSDEDIHVEQDFQSDEELLHNYNYEKPKKESRFKKFFKTFYRIFRFRKKVHSLNQLKIFEK